MTACEAAAGGRLPETLATEHLAWTLVAPYQGARVHELRVPSLDAHGSTSQFR